MSLKLFRATEFAQSRSFSPERQRRAIHPAWIVLLTSVWLAVVGNRVLWQAINQIAPLASGAGWWLDLRIGLMVAACNCMLLALFMWRRLLKPAALAMMFTTAWYATTLDTSTWPANWPALLAVLPIAVLPGAWLLRSEVRRLPLWRNLANVTVLACTASLVFMLCLLFSYRDLRALWVEHPELLRLVSPYAMARQAASLEKVLLPAKQ